MQKYTEQEVVRQIAVDHGLETRRTDVTTKPVGEWLHTVWTERLAMPATEFAAMMRELGEKPTESRILEHLGVAPEGVVQHSLRFTYGIDHRRGLRPTVYIRWEGMSADATPEFLAAIEAAAAAVSAS